MVADKRVCLGVVTAAHGVRGEVKLRAFTAEPADIAAYGPLEDGAGERRFRITEVKVTAKAVVARFAGIDDRDAAEALRGTELWVDRQALPPTDEDEWYVEDLVGLEVVDERGRPVGKVRAVVDYGAGDVVEIRGEAGKEWALPFTRDQFPEVDVAGGRLTMATVTEFEVAGAADRVAGRAR
ncbi:MAG: ribosome maturation factor RimM [Geminicoccaceae bacterium]|nr:MAG: ribosome maturation factor RimM [Geminicoccaceae bacterium]